MRTSQAATHQELIPATYAVALHQLQSSSKDWATFLVDTAGHVVRWNEPAASLFGFGADEIVGQHLSWLSTEAERRRDGQGNELSKAAAEGRIQQEGWWMRKDRTRFWATRTSTRLREVGGHCTGTFR